MSNILLLEDDLSLINGLSFAFKKQGFELNIARTLKEAEELWTDGKYDLLVLDVSLPDGSGFEFCKRVRLTSKVPIIFLTASDEETSIIMGLDIGGDDYITKPFGIGELRARVAAHIRRENREIFKLNFQLFVAQRIADTENSRVENTDNIAGVRFFNNGALLREELLRLRQLNRLAALHVVHRHAFFEHTAANTHKSNAVAMRRVHVSLNFKHKRTEQFVVRA